MRVLMAVRGDVPFSLGDGLDLVALGFGGQFNGASQLLLLPFDLLSLHLEQAGGGGSVSVSVWVSVSVSGQCRFQCRCQCQCVRVSRCRCQCSRQCQCRCRCRCRCQCRVASERSTVSRHNITAAANTSHLSRVNYVCYSLLR